MDDDLLICRCEEVTLGKIKEAIALGLTTVEEVRRYTRAGMGLCQGKTCGRLLQQILARELCRSQAEIRPAACRPPVRPVELAVLARGAE
ncbi:MAG: (2Fe-2S)-binding protein [Anaerolineae bacterium]